MRALVKRQPERGMTLEQRDVPTPGAGEVSIRVESVGIDGGAEALIYDWHESKHRYEPALPQLFGHEFAGVVDEVHSSVERVQAGERVAVEPVVGCGTCRHCRTGSFAICPDRRLIGLDADSDGAFAEYVTVPGRPAEQREAPILEGLEQDRRMLEDAIEDDDLRNTSYLNAAMMTERIEMSAYEGLSTMATQIGYDDEIRKPLESNFDEEQSAYRELSAMESASELKSMWDRLTPS